MATPSVLIALLLLLLGPSLAAAQTCVGAPPEETTTYGEPRVFLEAQGWWGARRADGSVPRYGDAEHLHVGTCFPLNQAVSGVVTLRVRVLGHNMQPGAFISRTDVGDANSSYKVTKIWNVKADPFTANVTAVADIQLDTTKLGTGWRELRFQTKLVRPDNAEIHASTSWCVNLQNGGTVKNDGACVGTKPVLEGRGWYSCFEYKKARLQNFAYPWKGVPAGAPLTFSAGMLDGAGSDTLVTGFDVRLDPDLHHGVLGARIGSGTATTGTSGKTFTIPGALLTPGLHKLMLVVFVNGTCQVHTGEMAGTVVVPLRVN
jgi:hypothetical protein